MTRRDWLTLTLLTLAATIVQLAGLAGIARLRGSPTAYAYQSPDAAEYVALGRGLAHHGRYVRIDAHGRQHGGPDTWRTPGYPLVLAATIRFFGDATHTLLALNQTLAIASVPLIWLILRRFCRPRWAVLGTLGWAVDPFRIYYSLWLLAETLFTCVLLIACLLWTHGTARGWTWKRSLALGALAGALVLIRPIGMLLPVVAALGVLLSSKRHHPEAQPKDSSAHQPEAPARARFAVLCSLFALLGATLILAPWLVRIRLVGGHWALSDQSGASFAYHKVVDVVLWSEGRPAWRFNPAATAEVRERIDVRLRELWQEKHGPLTPAERQALRWQKLNFGEAEGIDRFEASALLWRAGLEQLDGRWGALVQGFVFQGLSMLTFPLGLVIAPPAGQASSPLAMLGGGGRSSQLAAIAIGLAYTALAAAALVALCRAAAKRHWHPALFAALPALTLFVLSLPSEDPRFRLPIIPLLWILACALARASRCPRPVQPNTTL